MKTQEQLDFLFNNENYKIETDTFDLTKEEFGAYHLENFNSVDIAFFYNEANSQ